ncbi:related to nuclear associated protein [Ustilago trichophora]|uniref:Related to nuclear associated protein n=1 Tax=Ustilago trichophora TaxID=86804 RepID=A0A5C3DWQ0_9BASI|nr:related to nuclear associated protein [Ustilago trichophora]
MDVDKLFKLPSLPSAAVHKRKWTAPAPEDPTSSSSVISEAGPSEPSAARPSKAARVDDEDDEGDAIAPEDETYFFSDDDQEDGRFFSGGLTAEQNQILDIMDSGPSLPPNSSDPSSSSTSDVAALRKQLVRFERAITKNSEMRVKYASNPARFIDSEADLHVELKSLLVLTTQPEVFYPEFIKLGGVGSLVGLLSHENADIAAAAIEVLEELTDDDVLDAAPEGEDEDQDEDDARARAGQAMDELVESLLQQSVLELLVSNLGRFNDVLDANVPEDEAAKKAVEAEGDAQAIYHTLGAIENLVSSRPNLSELLVSKTTFLKWTLNRLSTKRTDVDQNTSYAAELLAILLQNSTSNRTIFGTTTHEEENGIDILLTIISRYRRTPPSGAEEAEYVENIFLSLCLSLTATHNKHLFLSGEGVELMILLMKEKRSFARLRAVKVLDHATSGPDGGAVCRHLVESNGLSGLFGVFMDCNNTSSSRKKAKQLVTLQDAEHVLGVFSSLLTHLASESVERIRVLSKFVADDYARLDHLLDLRDTLITRLESALPASAAEKEGEEEEDEDELYLSKLEKGLFSLQLLDTVLAWIVMEDDAAKDHVKVVLKRKGLDFNHVAATLKEYRDNIGDQISTTGQGKDEQNELKTKDILSALITYLEAL